MEVQWKDKNVQLSALTDFVSQFFAERKFSVSRSNSDGNYRVIAEPRRSHEIAENVNVSISGKPNDFTVEFIAGPRSRALVIFGTLTASFGGGSLSLKGLKSREALEKLEQKFWAHLTEKVLQLADSARQTNPV